ncbi:MAG TPA: diguanylate cyclase [Pararhizobium sp.]|uniref:diguanylate cyclase n=1 Tax=Pararhizobium sp. TaxID=1977563 RepID=UPI002BDAE0C5|nr:diguanylate cyclase [Pararhizobium sp.]HTO31006.1 diguanylate cyclase [Pararhizobium sp.]
MSSAWYELLANLAILSMLVLIWSNARLPHIDCPQIIRQFAFGLLLGLGAIIVMMRPFEIGKGVFIDSRATLVAVSGLFGGPVALIVTAFCATAFRVYLGGAGVVAGLTGIGIAAVVGVLGHALKKNERPSTFGIIIFSACVAAGGPLSFLVMPQASLSTLLSSTIAPIAIIAFAATLLVSLAVANEIRRRDAVMRNHVYKTVIDSLPDCLNVKDMEGRFIVANPATAMLMKVANPDALLGKTDFDFYPFDIAEGFRADEQNTLLHGTSEVIEQQVTHRDGSTATLSTLKSPVRDSSGRVTGLITHNRDVTAKVKLEAALAESERVVTAALTNMADGLIMFDKDLRVVFCNEQYRTMFPLTADLRVPGTPAASILYASIARGELINIPTDNVTDWVNAACSRLRQPGTVQFPLYDGRWIESRTSPAADGTCFVVCSDITKGKQSEQALRDLNMRLAELAETDGLTGLLNRRAFDAALTEEVARVGRGEGALSLLLLDVDRFKAFNDTYGHTAGDDCLRAIAECMRAVARRSGDRAARYGGEEMVLILPNTPEEGAVALAHELRNRIRTLQIAHTGSEKGIVTASIGVATLANHTMGPDAGRLVVRADEALYLAKASGRDLVRTWEPAKPKLVSGKSGG